MECSDWIAIGSLIVALVALGFSLWGYFVYDRPIKELQKQELEQEAIAKKQARIKLDYCFNKYNNPILLIENVGQADARNVVLRNLSEEPAFYSRQATNDDEYLVGMLRACDSPQTISTIYRRQRMKMEVIWDDESAFERKETLELNCNARS